MRTLFATRARLASWGSHLGDTLKINVATSAPMPPPRPLHGFCKVATGGRSAASCSRRVSQIGRNVGGGSKALFPAAVCGRAPLAEVGRSSGDTLNARQPEKSPPSRRRRRRRGRQPRVSRQGAAEVRAPGGTTVFGQRPERCWRRQRSLEPGQKHVGGQRCFGRAEVLAGTGRSACRQNTCLPPPIALGPPNGARQIPLSAGNQGLLVSGPRRGGPVGSESRCESSRNGAEGLAVAWVRS